VSYDHGEKVPSYSYRGWDLSAGLSAEKRNRKRSRYSILEIQPFDMFPQTYHVENVVMLEKNKDPE
jgi:hypothetical protein